MGKQTNSVALTENHDLHCRLFAVGSGSALLCESVPEYINVGRDAKTSRNILDIDPT